MEEAKEAPELLRIPEAAALLAISRTKLYELVEQGAIPHVRVGQSIRIPRRRLLAWLEANTRETSTPRA